MGLIHDLSVQVNTALATYDETVFTAVSAPILILLKTGALLGLLFIAINSLIQFSAINYSVYLHWGLRYIILYTFLSAWSNFEGIYHVFMDIPSDYAALMIQAVALKINAINTDVLDPSKMSDITSEIDEFGHAIWYIAWQFLSDISIFDIGDSIKNVFIGVVVLIVGAIFFAAGAIIMIASKVGFALAISFAPLAIVMLMLDQTKHHFESWVRFTIGFAIIPLLLTGLMTIVLYVAGSVLVDASASDQDKNLWLPFIFVMIAAVYLLLELPGMAHTLANASTAAVGTGLARYMTNKGITSPAQSLTSISKNYARGQHLRDAAGVAASSLKSGASVPSAAWGAISAWRQSGPLRNQRRDQRLAGRIEGYDGPTSAARRYNEGMGADPAKTVSGNDINAAVNGKTDAIAKDGPGRSSADSNRRAPNEGMAARSDPAKTVTSGNIDAAVNGNTNAIAKDGPGRFASTPYGQNSEVRNSGSGAGDSSRSDNLPSPEQMNLYRNDDDA